MRLKWTISCIITAVLVSAVIIFIVGCSLNARTLGIIEKPTKTENGCPVAVIKVIPA